MGGNRLATFGVPAAAGVMTAAVLLGPGEERPVMGAKVHGQLAAGAQVCAFRLETIRHQDGLFQPAATDGLLVTLRDPEGQTLCTWEGSTEEPGRGETSAPLSRPAAEGDRLTLRVEGAGKVLAQARVTVGPELVGVVPPRWSTPGPPAMEIGVPRSHLAPEHPEGVSVEVRGPESPRPTMKVEVTGGEHEPVVALDPACKDDVCRHRFLVPVVARAPSVRLAVTAEVPDGPSSHWEGDLPLVPGGLWLDPKALGEGKLRLRSATPREEAFISLYGPAGRVWGAHLPLVVDEAGFAEGELPAPKVPNDVAAYRLSSDADEPSGATTMWPTAAATPEGSGLQLLADGLPAVVTNERARATQTRWPVFGLVIAAGIFEVVYLLLHHRREGAALDQQMAAITKKSLRTRTPLWWLALLTGGLALLFFVLAAVAAFA